jgi:hypothetical protein
MYYEFVGREELAFLHSHSLPFYDRHHLKLRSVFLATILESTIFFNLRQWRWLTKTSCSRLFLLLDLVENKAFYLTKGSIDTTMRNLKPQAMRDVVDISNLTDFLHAGVAMNLASCSNLQKPAVCRGLGCRLVAESGHLSIFVSRHTSAELLDNIGAHPQIAAVFCLPLTEQAIQIKGLVTLVRPLTAMEHLHLDAHRNAFTEQISPLGYSKAFIDCYLYAEDPVTLLVKPMVVYQQTPGPLAGSLLAQ